ncbi:MAG: hypothetical protein ACYS8X_09075 [Planctomycetota bacterium]
MTRIVCVGVLLGLLVCGGCNQIAGWSYVFGLQDQTKTVPAEFGDLAHSTVAVVIHADEQVQYEYPDATLNLSAVISSKIRKNVDGCRTINPLKIRAYQHENLDWQTIGRDKLGEALGADYVLLVSLREYSTREPGSLNLYRGRINAEAAVFRVHDGEGAEPVWQDEYLETAYPKEPGPGKIRENDERIRYKTDTEFATLLVERFYKHEAPRFQ